MISTKEIFWVTHQLRGHEEVVRILLRREEVNPDKPDKDGQTQLSYAASGGYEGEAITRTGRGLS